MSDTVYEESSGTNSTEDSQFIAVVRKSWREADRFREPIRKKWDYHFRLLNGFLRDDIGSRSWRTNRFVNVTRVASSLLKSRFFQGMPVGQAEGRTLEAQINEDAMNQVLKYDQERGKLVPAMGKFIDDGIHFACGVMQVGWRTETMENLPRSENFITKMVKAIRKLIPGFKETGILFDGPTFDWVDPWSFRWDSNGTDIDECAWVGTGVDESIYKLRKDPAIDEDTITKLIAFEQQIIASKSTDIDDRFVALGLTKTEGRRLYGKVKEGLHEVVRYWGTYDIDGDGLEEEVRGIIIDWAFVGCLEENPYWHGKKPFVKWGFEDQNGFFVGRSLIDQTAQSQEELNDLENQSGDVRKLTLRPVIKMRLGADIEPETISFAPGAIIPVESMDDIDFYQPPTDAIQRLLEVKKYEREMFQLLTGMNDVSLGQQDVGIGNNTATGAAIAQEQTELRYKSPAIGLDLCMERIGELLIWNEQQFRIRKDTVPVRDAVGKVTYKKIAPKDLSGLFSYRMVSSSLSMQSPTMKINNLLKALEVIQGDPSYNAAPIVDQVIKELGIDPGTLKSVSTQDDGSTSTELEAVAKFKQLPPDIQQKELAKMSPEDRELFLKALNQTNASPQNAQPQVGVPTTPTLPPGAPTGTPQAPAPAPGMGTAA